MIRILMVAADGQSLSGLAAALEKEEDVSLHRCTGGENALKQLQVGLDLVVADAALGDMSGLELAREIVALNPMVNCALVSDLAPEVFHETTEGLGILMQLPPQADSSDAVKLMQQLKLVLGFKN